MKKMISFLPYLLIPFFSFSQKTKLFTVQPGQNVKDVIPFTELYAYANFCKGTVFLKTAGKSSALLNYSYLSQEIHFIDKNSDTLALTNPAEVKIALIENDYFYFTGEGFAKKDTVIGDKTLATAKYFMALNSKQVSAYGMQSEGGIDSYHSFFSSSNGAKVELTPQVITTVAKRQILYIGDRFSNFYPATKKNIFLLYEEKQNKLSRYLKSKEVNYFSKQDIIDLIIFMNHQ